MINIEGFTNASSLELKISYYNINLSPGAKNIYTIVLPRGVKYEIDHHFWSDKYNYCLSIEDKHTLDHLLLQQDPEIIFHNSYLINLISCETDLTSTPFSDTKFITYEI